MQAVFRGGGVSFVSFSFFLPFSLKMTITGEQYFGLTGFTKDFLEGFWSRVGCPKLFNAFCLTMCQLKLNLTWDACAALTPLFYPDMRDESTCRKDLVAVVDALEKTPWMDPLLRWNYSDPRWPGVTALLDCTTIRCRDLRRANGRDATFSGKHREHCWKLEVFTTVTGIPICFRGPALGSAHDMKVFHTLYDTAPFDHLEDEVWLGDLGYVSASHVVTPFKAGEDDGMLGTRLDAFNDTHSRVRSRIERTFAWLDRFHIFWETDCKERTVSRFVSIALNIEVYRRLVDEATTGKQTYKLHWLAAAPPVVVNWSRSRKCNCRLKKESAVATKARRLQLCDHLDCIAEEINSEPPKKAAKGKRPRAPVVAAAAAVV